MLKGQMCSSDKTGLRFDEGYSEQIGQIGQGSQLCSKGQKGMVKEGRDHSPLEGEWTHLEAGEYMVCLGSWFLILEHVEFYALHLDFIVIYY
jgi:hypothetical protein